MKLLIDFALEQEFRFNEPDDEALTDKGTVVWDIAEISEFSGHDEKAPDTARPVLYADLAPREDSGMSFDV
ncbi:hypothetical protein ACOTTU_24130 [Roseobacter sp. EG26]|uniref:hypothetical protein n=1 Tax=Roseobacter sp. EG26 TaxID=3412477 RepID=UPI003CE4560C